MASPYPVHYSVERPARFSRINLLVRVLAFIALGVLGLTFGTVFLFAYLILPVFAAARLGNPDSTEYHRRDAPRVVAALHWFGAACAWAGLTTERHPRASPSETVTLEIDETAP